MHKNTSIAPGACLMPSPCKQQYSDSPGHLPTKTSHHLPSLKY